MTVVVSPRDPGRRLDDSALNAAMDRYACGEAAAFPRIHRALFPRLLAFLTRMSGSTTVADDLVQETFLRMHRARSEPIDAVALSIAAQVDNAVKRLHPKF